MRNFESNKDTIHDRQRPKFYQGLVSQQEYEQILDYAITAVQKIGEIDTIADGTIKLKNIGEEHRETQFHLDNLVRICKSSHPNEWKSIVNDHFSKFDSNPAKEKYIQKDFDFAAPMIKVLVRLFEDFQALEEFVYRVDFPGTHTFLILDYDNKFHFIRKDQTQEWEKTTPELFEIALDNIAQEEIIINEGTWDDTYEMFSFFSGDFSASFMVDLQRNAHFAIGKYGSVVAIPTKGSALVHPINGTTALNFISSFYKAQQNFFNEDAVPITDKFFWYYRGKYELFPEKVNNNGSVTISNPIGLLELLK